MWITNGTIADLAIVWAKLDGKIRGFIVEKGDKGFTAPEMKGKHSLRASITSELVFQDCRIPKDKIEQAHAYLRENELGDIIKNQVITSFGTGEDNMAGDLAGHIQDQYGITPDVKESVHPSTLKATLKKRHEEGLSDPDDLFGIFIRPETKITKGKKQ